MNEKLTKILVKKSKEEFKKIGKVVHLVDDTKQNKLLNNLKKYPHAYVLACIMDKQIKADKAWSIPYKVKEELRTFDIDDLANVSKDKYIKMFNKLKLHRFNKSCAIEFYEAIQMIVNKYDGEASKIWKGKPSSKVVVGRFKSFKGVGPKIATMATNILAKQFKIPMSDYKAIDISADVHVQRTMKRLGYVKESASIDSVIKAARKINPDFPGLIDFALWKLGKDICRPQNPKCNQCYLRKECKYYNKTNKKKGK